jgi:hypothetical protein
MRRGSVGRLPNGGCCECGGDVQSARCLNRVCMPPGGRQGGQAQHPGGACLTATSPAPVCPLRSAPCATAPGTDGGLPDRDQLIATAQSPWRRHHSTSSAASCCSRCASAVTALAAPPAAAAAAHPTGTGSPPAGAAAGAAGGAAAGAAGRLPAMPGAATPPSRPASRPPPRRPAGRPAGTPLTSASMAVDLRYRSSFAAPLNLGGGGRRRGVWGLGFGRLGKAWWVKHGAALLLAISRCQGTAARPGARADRSRQQARKAVRRRLPACLVAHLSRILMSLLAAAHCSSSSSPSVSCPLSTSWSW